MSFKASNLNVLAYANNFTLWHYVTDDRTVSEPGYFNQASDMFRKNDLVIANQDTEGQATTINYVVSHVGDDSVQLTAYGKQPGLLAQVAAAA